MWTLIYPLDRSQYNWGSGFNKKGGPVGCDFCYVSAVSHSSQNLRYDIDIFILMEHRDSIIPRDSCSLSSRSVSVYCWALEYRKIRFNRLARVALTVSVRLRTVQDTHPITAFSSRRRQMHRKLTLPLAPCAQSQRLRSGHRPFESGWLS